jgi:serine phosphatase RsbU (regulator of sigma subunit)
LNTRVIETLSQATTKNRDGMELTLIAYNKKNNTLELASGKRPVYHLSGSGMLEIKGDKSSVGGNEPSHLTEFTVKKILINSGDVLYMFSDGIIDQFGSTSGRFGTKRFEEILLSSQNETLPNQGKRIEQELSKWQADAEQTDDIIVMGIKF